MKVIVNVIVKQENKVLMVQENWGDVKGMWNFPAGHLDEGENIFEGAVREAKEETGYDVKLTGLVNIQNAIYDNRHIIHVVFAAEIVGGKISFDENEIMNVEFVEIDKQYDIRIYDKRYEDVVTAVELLKAKGYRCKILTK